MYFPNIQFSVRAKVMKIVHRASCFYLNSDKQRILLSLYLFKIKKSGLLVLTHLVSLIGSHRTMKRFLPLVPHTEMTL